MNINNFSLLFFTIVIFTVVVVSTSSTFSFAKKENLRYTPDPFLQNWMSQLSLILSDVTLNDISVPGSHDSGTYDLTSTFADDANDLPTWLSYYLHDFHDIIDKTKIGPWIRNQAKTQGLTFTQQLDSGLRFIDFRIDFTAGPNSSSSPTETGYDWYVMHMMQSQQTAMTYLKEMRQWQREHPNEIVVYWVSHHGTPCAGDEVYANANKTTKLAFWNQIVELYSDIIFDASLYQLNTTTIGQLQQLGQTAIFYLSDYQNFTDNSKYAQFSCLIDNDLPGDGTPEHNVDNFLNRYQGANYRIQSDKQAGRYYLMSGSGPDPSARMVEAFELEFLGNLIDRNKTQTACAANFGVPGSTWCPQYLQETSQWANFYHQIAFEYSIQQQIKNYENGKSNLGFRFPNAIYIDAVDIEGTVRTGSQIFWPQNYSSSTSSSNKNNNNNRNNVPSFTNTNLDAKYSYTDTLLLSNALWICSGGATGTRPSIGACANFIQMLSDRRAKYPFLQWTDLTSGRLENYPPFP